MIKPMFETSGLDRNGRHRVTVQLFSVPRPHVMMYVRHIDEMEPVVTEDNFETIEQAQMFYNQMLEVIDETR